MRPARTADSSAVLVLPNDKVKLEGQHAIHPLSLHNFLGKALPLQTEKQFYKKKKKEGRRVLFWLI
jgi:hypothetical protein